MTAAVPHPAPLSDDPNDDRDGARMGFLEHLDELRKRIIRSCVAIGAGMVAAFFFHDQIGDFLLAPTLRTLPRGGSLVITRPGEGFAFYLDVSLIAGLVFAAPVIAYQLWRFIAPGLYAKEKKFAVPFVVLITMGSVGAGLFTHYVMFPATIGFLAGFHSRSMTFMPRVEDTFDLYKMMLLGMIVVFQIPTVVFFLAKMHLVTARLLWRHVKYAVLVAFIAAAVLTPSSDPWNQMIFAAPMLVLYVASIGIAWAAAPRRPKATAPDAGGAPLRLIVTGAVIEHAWAHGKRSRLQSRVNLRSR